MSEDEDDSKDSQEKGTSKTSSKSLSSEPLGGTKSTSKTLSSEGTVQKKTQKTTGAHKKGASKSIAVKTVKTSASLGVRPRRSSDIIPICFTSTLYVVCLAALIYVIIRYISDRNELEKQIDRIPKK
ncbi:hypothetical protein V3C99_007368 [Haemonchus contortus]